MAVEIKLAMGLVLTVPYPSTPLSAITLRGDVSPEAFARLTQGDSQDGAWRGRTLITWRLCCSHAHGWRLVIRRREVRCRDWSSSGARCLVGGTSTRKVIQGAAFE